MIGIQYLPPAKKSGKPIRYERSFLLQLAASLYPEKYEHFKKFVLEQRYERRISKQGYEIETANEIAEALQTTSLFSGMKQAIFANIV